MIIVTVNGKRREFDVPHPLMEFLASNRLQERRIAVGYNGDVVHKDRWHAVVLGDGDVLEIVQMVGGG